MADDDFESSDPAPLPSYDREWRHPAEHVDAQRSVSLATAPPVGRRLLTLTAVVSLLASASLLFVVVPKGISEYTSGEREEPSATPVPSAVKTAAGGVNRPEYVARVATAGDSSTAVYLGSRLFIVPLHIVAGAGPFVVSNGAKGSVATVVQRYVPLGLALVRTATPVAGVKAIDPDAILDPDAAAELPGHTIVDAWSVIEFAPEKSIMTHDADGDVAIGAAAPVNGLGVVVDTAGRAVGVVVHRAHSSWIVARSWITRVVAAWS